VSQSGVIEETAFGPFTTCHVCGTSYMVDRDGLIVPHTRPFTDSPCPNRWGAADLSAAIDRDQRLNEEELRVRNFTYAWLISCKGYTRCQDGSVEVCHHPRCQSRINRGMHWSLNGWVKEERS